MIPKYVSKHFIHNYRFYWVRTPAVPLIKEEIKNNVRKNSDDKDSFR
jgi:hypothetical protein